MKKIFFFDLSEGMENCKKSGKFEVDDKWQPCSFSLEFSAVCKLSIPVTRLKGLMAQYMYVR